MYQISYPSLPKTLFEERDREYDREYNQEYNQEYNREYYREYDSSDDYLQDDFCKSLEYDPLSGVKENKNKDFEDIVISSSRWKMQNYEREAKITRQGEIIFYPPVEEILHCEVFADGKDMTFVVQLTKENKMPEEVSSIIVSVIGLASKIGCNKMKIDKKLLCNGYMYLL